MEAKEGEKEITVNADGKGNAQTLLRVGVGVEEVFISASVQNYVASQSFELKRAFPEKIQIQTSTGIIKTSEPTTEVPLEAILSRSHGKVSDGTTVQFEAFLAGTPSRVGKFSMLEASPRGEKVTKNFLSNTGDWVPGTSIDFIVSTSLEDGSLISDTLTVATTN